MASKYKELKGYDEGESGRVENKQIYPDNGQLIDMEDMPEEEVERIDGLPTKKDLGLKGPKMGGCKMMSMEMKGNSGGLLEKLLGVEKEEEPEDEKDSLKMFLKGILGLL
jgi:hypothetical protein